MPNFYAPICGFDEIAESRKDVSLQTVLASQSCYWSFVFDLRNNILGCNYTIYKIAECLSYFDDKCRVWWICHDREKNEDGSLKLPHIHLVLAFGNRQRLSRVLRMFCGAMELSPNDYICRKEDSETKVVTYVINPWISFEQVISLDKILRYLVHLDQKDEKEQYNPYDVITNDRETFEIAISHDSDDMAKGSYWVNLCRQYEYDFQEIAMHLPTKILKDNLFIIRELCNCWKNRR